MEWRITCRILTNSIISRMSYTRSKRLASKAITTLIHIYNCKVCVSSKNYFIDRIEFCAKYLKLYATLKILNLPWKWRKYKPENKKWSLKKQKSALKVTLRDWRLNIIKHVLHDDEIWLWRKNFTFCLFCSLVFFLRKQFYKNSNFEMFPSKKMCP